MKKLDVYLQKERIKKAKPWIRKNSLVLDIGCLNGELFKQIDSQIMFGYGLDPLLEMAIKTDKYSLIPGKFPVDIPKDIDSFDVITVLAVFEHISTENQRSFADECMKYLSPGGRVIVTVPSVFVDKILDVLLLLRLVDGMSLEEHHKFNPSSTPEIFTQAGFNLEYTGKFQFGLNNLFIFLKKI